MTTKVFLPFKKKPFFQPTEDMCVTAAIKNVIDNQFNTIFPLSEANKLCKYSGKYRWGIAIDNLEQRLSKVLEKMKIKYNKQEKLKLDNLFELLKRGIYPIVIFPLAKYNEWMENDYSREVFGDDEPSLHFLIIVGIDKEKKEILVFDTIKNKFVEYNDLKRMYRKINYVKFLQFWVHEDLVYPAIWFSKISPTKKLKRKEKTLEQWSQKKK